MSQHLQINGKTILLRSESGAVVADADPPNVTAPAAASIFGSGGHAMGFFYWTATAVAGGTVDLILWVWDAALGIWVKAKSYPNVVANDFFSAEVYNCSQLCWQISNPQGTVGTAFRLRGFAKNAR